MLHASDLGVVIGALRYRQVSEVLDRCWRQCAPRSLSEAYRATDGAVDLRARRAKLMADHGDAVLAHETIRTALRENRVLTAESLACRLVAERAEVHGLDAASTDVLQRAVADAVSGEFGQRNEATTRAAQSREEGVTIRDDNSVLRMRAWPLDVGFDTLIGGRLDGVCEDGGGGGGGGDGRETRLVEYKTRKHGRLFDKVPEYERAQLHAYMYITGARRIDWVQRTPRSGTAPSKMRKDIVEWDAAFWRDRVEPRARAFFRTLRTIVTSEDLRRRYVCAVDEHERTRLMCEWGFVEC